MPQPQSKTASKTALVTGITGQDGAYLAEFLLSKDYDVHGVVRWDAPAHDSDGLDRLTALDIEGRITLHNGDLTDTANIASLIKTIQPDEIYNLGALSHVAVSFETPAAALDINAKGTLTILDAVRLLGIENQVRVYQASSSEMFGASPPPQNEMTPMEPCSPYGVAKLAAYHLCKIYRESYGIHVSNGILFNHESPLRGGDFVTRKIAAGVAAIEAGSPEPLTLGNLNARRDWGHARDYVRGMWMMLQHDTPDDYVLATGQAHSVRDCVETAFSETNTRITWNGKGTEETGVCADTGRVLVTIDPALFRPKEVDYLLGDPKKARTVLGWEPETSFTDLIAEMVEAERKKQTQGKAQQWQKTG